MLAALLKPAATKLMFAPNVVMKTASAFAALVAQFRPSIDDLFNKVLAIPGVGDIAKPVIDGLRVKLDALSKA